MGVHTHTTNSDVVEGEEVVGIAAAATVEVEVVEVVAALALAAGE